MQGVIEGVGIDLLGGAAADASAVADSACPICGHGHSADIDRFEHWLLEAVGGALEGRPSTLTIL